MTATLRIGVIGATGNAGSLIVEEAVRRGHEVTAFVRNPDRLTLPVPSVRRELLDLTRDDVAKFDVLVSAYGVPVAQTAEHLPATRHLIDLLTGTPVRLIMVGSAGHLFTDTSRTARYWQTMMPEGPLRDGAQTLQKSWEMLMSSTELRWTYLAPPIEFIKNGERTGKYTAGTDVVLTDEQGQSRLSYADYAIAVVDEAETGAHSQRMFTVASIPVPEQTRS